MFCRGSGAVIVNTKEKYQQQDSKAFKRRNKERREAEDAAAAEAAEEEALNANARIMHVPVTSLFAEPLPDYKQKAAEGTSIAFGSAISLESCDGMFLGQQKRAKSKTQFDKNHMFKVFNCDNPTEIRAITVKDQVRV